MEDSGVGRHLPVGAGLLTYTDVDTAVSASKPWNATMPDTHLPRGSLPGSISTPDRVLERVLAIMGL